MIRLWIVISVLLLSILVVCGGCASTSGTAQTAVEDAPLAQASEAGMIAFERGDAPEAAAQYEAALQRARFMDDAAAVADAAYNLAVCEVTISRFEAAEKHLHEAEYNGRISGTTLDGVHLLMAKLSYLQQHDPEAEAIAEPLASSAVPAIRLQAQALLTLIACDVRQVTQAESRLRELNSIAKGAGNLTPALRAEIEKSEGSVALLEGNSSQAAAHFDQEAAFLRQAHRYRDVIHALTRSAAAHEKAGAASVAADRYYQAARGCVAVRDFRRAWELAGDAKSDAVAGHAPEISKLVDALTSEIDASADR
jgi:hypothetical protein